MNPQQLASRIQQKRSFLCVGLDTDGQKMPAHLRTEADPVFEFNRQVVAETAPYAVAYKLNLAFYEAMGAAGWESLARTLEVLPEDAMVMADAKRGDIGNTSRLYARTFFETYSFDAVTVAPYMGADSVTPFLEFDGKWVFLLALTSNASAQDFQYHREEGEYLYQRVIRLSQSWKKAPTTELGYVVGATQPQQLGEIRAMAPKAWLLVPGVGAQGGDVHAVCEASRASEGRVLINSSRGIIYAGQGRDFATQAGKAAKQLQQEMEQHF